MYKVLIADDEEWTLKALRLIVDWSRFDMVIAGEANNGADAARLYRQIRPDLVVSDIRMPGLNGIELLKRIRGEDKRSAVVFISAHSDFAYAQQALSLGAADYLLKPITQAGMEQMLAKVKERLQEERQIRSKLENYEALRLIEELTEARSLTPNLGQRLAQAGFSPESGYFRCAVVRTNSRTISALDVETETANRSYGAASLAIPTGPGRWLVVVQFDRTAKGEPYSRWKRIFGRCANEGATIGLSELCDDWSSFREAYRQAQAMAKQAFVAGRPGMYSYRDPGPIVRKLARLLQSAKQPAQLEALIERIGEAPKVRWNLEVLTKLYNMANAQLDKLVDPAESFVPVGEEELTETFADGPDVFRYLKSRFVREAANPDKAPSHKTVQQIVNEIREHYNRKITLSEMAERYHINLSYLSLLFKQETGKTFLQYLLDIRMDKAEELLKSGELSTYEICERVGYDDYFHFIKQFKKAKKTTPGEFRKSVSEPR
ncbi:response regulator [Cohnella sp. LGH]|uniref:response regulator n=1 Tax=Cohnella sp. LGH TaxID=1619153 RepID=UPI001ADA55BF|nr:response regulator [Cohnella sp. LGH]QTH40120.1 response regulator [Cohnella sp. LGH]